MNQTSITNIRDIRPESISQICDYNQGNVFQGIISSEPENEKFIVDGSVQAIRAFSCLVKPQKDDVVIYYKNRSADIEEAYITGVLHRKHSKDEVVRIEVDNELTIKSRRLNLVAGEHLDLKSLKTIDITAYMGALSLMGMNLVTSVKESIIQNAKNHINHVKHYTLNVKQLIRTHGKHHIMTADEEIRMDGERINMG